MAGLATAETDMHLSTTSEPYALQAIVTELLKNPVGGRSNAMVSGCSLPGPSRFELATGYGYAADIPMWARPSHCARRNCDGSDAASRLKLMAAAVR